MSESTLNFLIVGENDGDRMALQELLRSFGYPHTFGAKRVKDAIEILNAETVNVIISEWDLPGANGYTLLRLIKAQTRFKDVLFILMSDSESHEEVKVSQAAKMKVDAYLLKPVEASQLKKTLHQLLAKDHSPEP